MQFGLCFGYGVEIDQAISYDTALGDAQIEASGWVRELELPSGGTTRIFGSPLLIDGKNLPIRRPPPRLGQHTEAV
ncbi:CoA transferase [Bradyrhizobium sp. Ce-3]|uniref:CoA transferase n=1 Tax=Bradyrhizobium sp. Ce-3 TaxID=2913970 RepID=UPI00207E84FB|nr:hypothetical protein BRSPCE3_59680 [Bradyrhizobium sp. Ce-3]